MKMIGECRGCGFFDTEHKFCIANIKSRCIIKNEEVFCPCRICIVKGMCHDPCEDLIQYIHGYVDKHCIGGI